MNIVQVTFRAFSLSALLILANCSSSNTETVEEIIDESSDNKIVDAPAEEPASPDIPSPALVSEESSLPSSESAAEARGTSSPIQDLPLDQQPLETVNQVDNSQAGDLANTLPQQASPDVPPPPSLSEIVGSQEPLGAANETPDAPRPATEAKSKKSREKPAPVRSQVEERLDADNSSSHEVGGEHRVYIVQPGDTLGSISQVIYGSRGLWQSLASLNNLDKSTKIFPGDAIRYKISKNAGSFEGEWANLPKSTVMVQPSDTLSSVAARVMGSSHYWKLLWRWNETALENPHRIRPGLSLKYVKPADIAAFLTERKSRSMAH